jgi:hypothetical protein
LTGKVRVINKYRERPRLPEVGLYVGRPTLLGNPFKVTFEAQRGLMVDKYEEWLAQRMRHPNNPVYHEVMRLVEMVKSGQSLALECTCAPRRCHADILKRTIEQLLEKPDA